MKNPLGTAALEAGGHGLPVICSNRGGLAEIVEDNVTGFVVDAERPDQLAQAIRSFVERPSLITRMGKAARQQIQTKFALQQFAKKFSDIVQGM